MPIQGVFDLILPAPSTITIMSINAPYAQRILSGEKQIELRRTPVRLPPGMVVLIYHPQPMQAILGSFSVGSVISDTPDAIWEQYASECGIDEASYRTYFGDSMRAYAIVVRNARKWDKPLSLEQLRGSWPAFTPPQRYCLIHPGHPAHLSLLERLVEKGCLESVMDRISRFPGCSTSLASYSASPVASTMLNRMSLSSRWFSIP